MNLMTKTIDFREVAARKQASRDADEKRLAEGLITREELRRENSILAPFGPPVRIALVGLKPLR